MNYFKTGKGEYMEYNTCLGTKHDQEFKSKVFDRLGIDTYLRGRLWPTRLKGKRQSKGSVTTKIRRPCNDVQSEQIGRKNTE